MPTVLKLIGEKFHRLTVLRYAGMDKYGKSRWLCRCECGKNHVTNGSSLRSGNTKSCGCIRIELRKAGGPTKTHGMSGTKLYYIWNAMNRRCYEKKYRSYKWYGAKGVRVCNKWRRGSDAFISWALKNGYKEGLTIDRKRVGGNYCPSNCRWVTKSENPKRNRNKMKACNTSGHCGVFKTSNGKWFANITTDTGKKYLGTFKTKKEAAAARKAAEY